MKKSRAIATDGVYASFLPMAPSECRLILTGGLLIMLPGEVGSVGTLGPIILISTGETIDVGSGASNFY